MRECHRGCLLYFLKGSDLVQSRFGPRAHPPFYRIDVSTRTPPGLYYVSNFREKTAERLHVESLVRAHVTPVCSIHDISENLAADILAKFPAAIETSITFQPDTKRNFQIENLVTAGCTFLKINTRMSRPTAELKSVYNLSTEWHLPLLLQSGFIVSLIIKTQEHTTSAVHDQSSALGTPSSRSRLSRVHPTFGPHEAVARLSEELHSDRTEGTALLLAQSLFYLADRQSPCKRLQDVWITMREVLPIPERPRSRREQMVGNLGKEFFKESFALCSVQLNRHQYEHSQLTLLSSDVQNGRHRACLALGSNLGDRVEMIELAVREMSERGLTVLRTSALYETKPMYLENQDSFINGACEVCSTDANARSK